MAAVKGDEVEIHADERVILTVSSRTRSMGVNPRRFLVRERKREREREREQFQNEYWYTDNLIKGVAKVDSLDVNISPTFDQNVGYFHTVVGECIVEGCVILVTWNVD